MNCRFSEAYGTIKLVENGYKAISSHDCYH